MVPAIYQRLWFRALVLPAVVAIAWLLYRIRLQQLTDRLNMRMEEQMSERSRTAQELHDTLLQGFMGAYMQLSVADHQLPEDSRAKPLIRETADMIKRVIEEGRATVRGMRFGTLEGENLARALARVPAELEAEFPAHIRTIEEGHARALRPFVRDETYLIGREALVNALRHSKANHLEIEIDYTRHSLRLLIRDDGIGISPKILRDERNGHWGLRGMRERAQKIGAKLMLRSHPGSGTEVELSIPSELAFQADPTPDTAWWRLLLRG